MDSLQSFHSLWKLMAEYTFQRENQCSNHDLICVLCNKLMIDACHSVCGCRYCYKCISEYLRDVDNYCPGKNESCKELYLLLEVDVSRDRRINNRIAKLIVKCPNGHCDAMMELLEMEDHLRLCNIKVAKCPYVMLGCDNAIENNGTVMAHLGEDTLNHTQLMWDSILHLKKEVNALKLRMKEESSMNDDKMNTPSSKVEKLKEINVYADVIWKIDNFTNKLGPTVYSEPFYANDYKLCLSIFMNGDSIGLSCIIMKGEKDDRLKWPMKRAVTLNIIDQHTKKPHKSETFHFSTYANMNVFYRPLRDKSNFIVSNPFILYSEIKNLPSIIVKDTIIVSCIVSEHR